MNTLSWLIYAAEVSGSVSNIFSFVAFIAGTGAVIICIPFCFLKFDTPTIYSWEDREAKMTRWLKNEKLVGKLLIWLPAISIVSMAMGSVIPSRTTVYAIAASEMGESALKSETGGKAVKALNAWLDRQIAGEKDAGK